MGMMSQIQSFMPHGMCLLWRPDLMLLHVGSDALIALSYFAITFCIAGFVRRRADLEDRHRALALLFAAFIGLCGLTHLFSILVLWVPAYVWEGWLKAVTAAVSIATAAFLFLLTPQLLRIPSARALQKEIQAHQQTVAALDAARAALAQRVDVTESELRISLRRQEQSTALLRAIVESAPGLIYAKDREGRLLLANKATLELIGKPWAEVEGRRDNEFLSDPRQSEVVMRRDRLVMEGDSIQELEEVVDHPEKGRRVWLSTKTPLRDADGTLNGLVGVSVDITERKQLEANLLHGSRLSAMGEMAAALAHELNQPLSAIANYVSGSRQLLAAETPSSPLLEPMDRAIEQSLRAGQIIRRLRAFVSNEDAVRSPECVGDLIEEACSLALIGAGARGVKSSVRVDPRVMMVRVDRVQIAQVLHNLIRNALEAIEDTPGPTIDIVAQPDQDGRVRVSIFDNGPGLSRDVADRLFQPFVSSKGAQGMGVGLSISRTIVEAHGGRIWTDPRPGGGAAFHFTLPLAPAPVPAR